MVQFIRDRSFM